MRQRQINPAFAAAHGLSFGAENDPSKKREESTGQLELALEQARATGKLLLVDAGVATPLPSNLFDLGAGMYVNLSMDHKQSLNQHSEETLFVVDLSDNHQITGPLDERFVSFHRVQQLRFQRCQWSSLTCSFAELDCLSILDLSGNLLTEFDISLLPVNIQSLNLSDNRLQHLKSASEESSIALQLRTLDVSNNQLVALDISAPCPNLRTFLFHHNRIARFPSKFLESALDSVESIDASCNLIAESLDFSKNKNLKTIKVAMNRLTAVPMIPSSLITLDVSTNMIKDIQGMLMPTDDVASAQCLVDLMLHDNHLSEISSDVLEKCANLRRLDISCNKLRNLPFQLALLPKLETVRIASNPLFTFKRSDVESNPNAVLEVLRRRAPKADGGSSSSKNLLSYVRNQSIELSVPKVSVRGGFTRQSSPNLNQVVADLKASPEIATGVTMKLALSGFETIPQDLFSLLPNVTQIAISNGLTAFPTMLATSCPKLQRLDLSLNKLASLSQFPSSSTWSTSITNLNLSCNRIAPFPLEMLSQLVVLESLNLSSNKLESTTGCTWLPSTLTHLDLSENYIKDIETLVWTLAGCCPKIQTLRVAQNKLLKIPLVMGLFLEKRLTSLDLRFNPQQAVRHAVLEKPCKEQLLYLKNRLTKEQTSDSMKRLAQHQGSQQAAHARERVQPIMQPTEVSTSISSAITTFSSGGMQGNSTTEKSPNGAKARDSDESVDNPERQASLSAIAHYQEKIQCIQRELDTNFSLTQAKRYALKKQMAMERSKLIREERKVGLRK